MSLAGSVPLPPPASFPRTCSELIGQCVRVIRRSTKSNRHFRRTKRNRQSSSGFRVSLVGPLVVAPNPLAQNSFVPLGTPLPFAPGNPALEALGYYQMSL